MEVTKPELKFFLNKYNIKVTNWERTKKEVLYSHIIGDWNSTRSKLGLVTKVTYEMYWRVIEVVDKHGEHFTRTCRQVGKGSSSDVNAAVKVIQRFWRLRQGIQYKNIKAKFVCCCFF